MARKQKKTRKVWSGRFSEATSPLMEQFSRSIEVDRCMWEQDIAVNWAWAGALAELGIYSARELAKVRAGLEKIAQEFAGDRFAFLDSDEDIHVAIERRLTELAADAGARIHTGRSRNDQVATDLRLYLKQKIAVWAGALAELQHGLIQLAEKHFGTILPGYTHLQQAQPILLSHYLLAAFWGIDRTLSRLHDFYPRLDVLPLGAGALAGSAFPVNREKLAEELGFGRISPNSIEVTGDRECCAEILFIIAAFMSFLSRVCGDLQVWNSSEFQFIEFSDAFATGSSMMPQKKNPDAIELIRGKSAAAISAAGQILILHKGLPLTYNRDLQEDKRVTFRQLDEVILTTTVFEQALCTAKFNSSRMEAAIDSLTLATELADYLVRKHVPFRRAHELAGRVVRRALAQQVPLHELPLTALREICEMFDGDVLDVLSPRSSIAQRNIAGGTGEDAVKKQLRDARARAAAYAAHPFLRRE